MANSPKFNVLGMLSYCQQRAREILRSIGDPPERSLTATARSDAVGHLEYGFQSSADEKARVRVIARQCYEVISAAKDLRRLIRLGKTRRASAAAFFLAMEHNDLFLDYCKVFERAADGDRVELQRKAGRDAAAARKKPPTTLSAALLQIATLRDEHPQLSFARAAQIAGKMYGVSQSTIKRHKRKSDHTRV